MLLFVYSLSPQNTLNIQLYLLIHSEYPQSFIDSNITIMILFGKTRKNKTALIPLVDFPRDVYHFIDFFFGLNMSAIGRTGTDASILHFNQSLFHSICIYYFLFQILFGSKK